MIFQILNLTTFSKLSVYVWASALKQLGMFQSNSLLILYQSVTFIQKTIVIDFPNEFLLFTLTAMVSFT